MFPLTMKKKNRKHSKKKYTQIQKKKLHKFNERRKREFEKERHTMGYNPNKETFR